MAQKNLQTSFGLVLTAFVVSCFACDNAHRTADAPRPLSEVFSLANGSSLLPKTEIERVLDWEKVETISSNPSDFNCEIIQEYRNQNGAIIRLVVYTQPENFRSLKNDYKAPSFFLTSDECNCFTENGFTGTYRRYERTCPLVSDVRFVAFTRRNFVVSIISETGYGDLPDENAEWGIIDGHRVASRNDLEKLAQIVDDHPSWLNYDR